MRACNLRACVAVLCLLPSALACGGGSHNQALPDVSLAKPGPDAGDRKPSAMLSCGAGTVRAGDSCVAIDGGTRTVTIDGGTRTVAIDGGTRTVAIDGGTRTIAIDGGARTVAIDGGTRTVTIDAGRGLSCGPGTVEASGLCVPLDAGHPDDDAGSPPPPPPRNPIVAENAKPGTNGWVLDHPATAREIEGYASRASVDLGETIDLFVSTAEASFDIDVYRLGYYAGLGARLMLSATHAGTLQTIPSPDADGRIECDWSNPVTLQIPNDWVSGVYLAKLTDGGDGKQSYIVFVVRDDARGSDVLFQSSVTTFEAYNNWGGKSLYDFNSSGGRAHKVSFNRPYGLSLNVVQGARGLGAGEILTTFQDGGDAPAPAWEYPMLRYLEREGYDVSYATNVDTHERLDLLDHHKVFMSVGHDEYWSWRMRNNVESARDRLGVQIALFSGNVCYWQIRFEPDQHGAPSRTIVGYKDETLDPLNATADAAFVTTRFSRQPLDDAESSLVGTVFLQANLQDDLVVDDERSWVFAGTGLRRGDRLPGLLGYEVNQVPGALPAGMSRVMHSPWANASSSGSADTVAFAVPSGAWTFSAGTMQLAWGLDDFGSEDLGGSLVTSAAQRIAQNVLARLSTAPHAQRSPILLTDDFDSPGPNEPDWVFGVIAEGASALDPNVKAVRNGKLLITPRAYVTGLHHGGYVSARSFDLSDGAATVELVQAGNPASATDASFALDIDGSNWVRFTVEGTALVMQANVAGSVSAQSIAYDGVAQRFLRLRHESASSEFLWEASADAVSFTTLRRSSLSLPASALWAELEAGTYQVEAAPGIVMFDHAKIEQTGVADDFSGPRQPEHFTPATLSAGAAAYDAELAPIQSQGKLELRPAQNLGGVHATGYVSARAWDLTSGAAQVALERAASGSARTLFALGSDGSNFWRFAVRNGTIAFQVVTAGGALSETTASYDSVAMHYLKLAHDAQANALEWYVSPDANAWTLMRSAPAGFALDALYAELAADTTQAEATPGSALFDDFVLVEGGFPP